MNFYCIIIDLNSKNEASRYIKEFCRYSPGSQNEKEIFEIVKFFQKEDSFRLLLFS